jgi:hypothetical protein
MIVWTRDGTNPRETLDEDADDADVSKETLWQTTARGRELDDVKRRQMSECMPVGYVREDSKLAC